MKRDIDQRGYTRYVVVAVLAVLLIAGVGMAVYSTPDPVSEEEDQSGDDSDSGDSGDDDGLIGTQYIRTSVDIKKTEELPSVLYIDDVRYKTVEKLAMFDWLASLREPDTGTLQVELFVDDEAVDSAVWKNLDIGEPGWSTTKTADLKPPEGTESFTIEVRLYKNGELHQDKIIEGSL